MKYFKLEEDLGIENESWSGFEKSIRGFFTLIIMFLFLSTPHLIRELRYIDYGSLGSTITSYPVVRDLGDWTLNRTKYEVNKKDQFVISTMPGFEDQVLPKKYKDCVVYNRKNWTCDYDDGSGSFGFVDYEYFETENAFNKNITYVSKREWLLMKKK